MNGNTFTTKDQLYTPIGNDDLVRNAIQRNRRRFDYAHGSENSAVDGVLAMRTSTNVDDSIAFLKAQHEIVLNGLHEQLAQLQEKYRELEFCLTFEMPYISKEVRDHVARLERTLEERELECVHLERELASKERRHQETQKELFLREHSETKLQKEMAIRDQTIKQLQKQLQLALESKNGSGSDERSDVSPDKNLVPAPPRSAKDKNYRRPLSLYRRLLSLSSRTFGSSAGPALGPPTTATSTRDDVNGDDVSSVPHLPQLVTSPSRATHPMHPPHPSHTHTTHVPERPQMRQQLRLKNLDADLNYQTLAIERLSMNNCRSQHFHSEHQQNNF